MVRGLVALCVVCAACGVRTIGDDGGSDGSGDAGESGGEGDATGRPTTGGSGSGSGGSGGSASSSGSSSSSSSSGGETSGGSDGTDDGSIRLDMPVPPLECPDKFADYTEPNDTPATARETYAQGGTTQHALCRGEDDVDYVLLRHPARGSLSARLTPIDHEAVAIRMSLYDRDGVTLLDEAITWPPHTADVGMPELGLGEYLLEIVLIDADVDGRSVRYELTLDAITCGTDPSVRLIPCLSGLLEAPADPQCRVSLDPVPPEPDLVEVVAPGCVFLPRLMACDGSDGWTYPKLPSGMPDYRTIQLCGAWCDRLNAGTELEGWYFCNP